MSGVFVTRMPNALAYLALAIWPIVTVILFRRHKPDRALILTLLVAYLFLPEYPAAFDLPVLPPLDKHTIPSLTAFFIVLYRGDAVEPWMPSSIVGKTLLIVYIFSPIMTALNNGAPVFFGQVGLPGLGLKDALALILQQFLMILPFLLARQFLRTRESQWELMRALMVGGLVYSLLMLIEIRVSPQLNLWVYGYFQHFFGQSVRFGGYRPVVFLYHGIWVAFYCMMALVAAFALWRASKSDLAKPNAKFFAAGIYLLIILFLAKSLGAWIFAAILLPLVIFTGPRTQIKVAALIAVLAVGYPVLKGANLIPEEKLLEQAAAVQEQRAASLRFRFQNENILLERAYEKPIFGWGSWGRNHILDPITGALQTITDGRWIIVIGVYGWVGFLAEFGLLTLPIFLILFESAGARSKNVSFLVAPMALLLAINVSDLLPNATLTPLTWIMAGALTGYAEALRAARLKKETRQAVQGESVAEHEPLVEPKWQSIL